MKVTANGVVVALLVALVTATAVAQPPEGRPGRGRDRQRGARGPERPGQGRLQMLPIIAALDADEDGQLSAQEIENAVAALKTLDKNGDGKLSRDEWMPRGFPQRGPGGPGGRGQGRRDARGPQGPPGRDGRDPAPFGRRIMEMDKNDDGKLTKDEVPERMQRMFERVDANSDGTIDEQEIRQMARRRAQGGGRPRGDRPPRGRRPRGD